MLELVTRFNRVGHLVDHFINLAVLQNTKVVGSFCWCLWFYYSNGCKQLDPFKPNREDCIYGCFETFSIYTNFTPTDQRILIMVQYITCARSISYVSLQDNNKKEFMMTYIPPIENDSPHTTLASVLARQSTHNISLCASQTVHTQH